MLLLKYFQRKEKIPDPEGTLSHSILPCSIAWANCKAKEELRRDKNPKK